jgi:hypothetical protein
MITFPNGAKTSLGTMIAVGVFRSLIYAVVMSAFRSLAAWTWLLAGLGMVYVMPVIEGYVLHSLLVVSGLMTCPGCVVHRKDGHG